MKAWSLAARSFLGLLAAIHGMQAANVAGAFQAIGPAVDVLALVTSLLAAMVFLFWFHAAVRFAPTVACDVGVGPWTAVVSWLIPLANLVWPFLIVRRLLFKSNTGFVLAWAATWILGGVLAVCGSLVALARTHPKADPLQDGAFASMQWFFSFTGDTLLMIAAGLGALIVAHVTRVLLSRLDVEVPAE